jgi:hypothetical protein
MSEQDKPWRLRADFFLFCAECGHNISDALGHARRQALIDVPSREDMELALAWAYRAGRAYDTGADDNPEIQQNPEVARHLNEACRLLRIDPPQ